MNHPDLTTVDRFFAAIESKAPSEVAALYADDVEVWHNFTKACQDKPTNVATLTAMCEHVAKIRYEVVERLRLDDGRILQRHVLCATAPNGEEFRIPACLLLRVRDGKIARIDEYLDTGQANRLRVATGRPAIVSA